MKRSICVFTGTRAEYGLLKWLMKGIKDENSLDLQVIVTGTHLSPEFGLTYREIENDGFEVHKKVEMILSSDTPSAIIKATGLGMIGFADALAELKPDIVLLLGDRFEMLAASFTALVSGIPIAHIHGGETTVGAFDEAIRHSITKMSYWHFVAADEYRDRVIQLGEDPKRVFTVGGLGVDAIARTEILDNGLLENGLGINFGEKNLLITYHPETLKPDANATSFGELLTALSDLKNTHFIFTTPNADTGGRIIQSMIEKFVAKNKERAVMFKSLGQLRYFSCLHHVDAVVGNSSSGLTEAPSFGIGTINIGDRQKGRLKSKSVIDCVPTTDSIKSAIAFLYSEDFQRLLKNVHNPYGEGNASQKILDLLSAMELPISMKKKFCDL